MNQNSKIDLIVLTHPLILLSIFILLINDHVLKVYIPSALTGKISDFAGLFFFPILLSAILNLVFQSFQSRKIALASFIFTAIWFSLIKTIPFFKNLTENIFNIQIVLDPSDLMALIMLPLAWRLREKVENESKTGISKLSYVVLGIASLATIATSPPIIPMIYNITVHENIVYAEFDHYYGTSEGSYYFYSTDGGKTWQELDFELPNEVAEQTGKYSELPFTLCLPNNKNVCYQTGTEIILESNDGGKTWTTSWEFPLGRSEFFQRASFYNYLGPYDIANIELEGNQFVIVSMGSEGVLVKVNNNEWESIKVDTAGPIYFSAKDFKEASSILYIELIILFIISFIYLYINVILNIQNRKTKGYYFWIITSCICVLTPIFLYLISLLPYDFQGWFTHFFVLFDSIFMIIVGFSILFAVVFMLYNLFANTHKRAKINLIPIAIITLISYSLFIFWAYGTIPVYETAQRIAIGLYILLLIWILYLPIKEYIQTKISSSKHDLPE
ncbi:MAG TPA: hypothetical protein DIW23_04545 [Anaerolineae bacterium]|nr:hypothetical protein [Anaerolineae bacterium]